MPSFEINVVMFEREPGAWVAQCLEYDLGAQAETLPDLQYQLQRCLVGHVVIATENKCEPFTGMAPAPEEYWRLWSTARMEISRESSVLPFSLPRSVPVPVPRYRVAA